MPSQAQLAESLLETLRRMKPEQQSLSGCTLLRDLQLDSLDSLELFYLMERYIPEVRDNAFNVTIPRDCKVLETGVEATNLQDVFNKGTVNDLVKVIATFTMQQHHAS